MGAVVRMAPLSSSPLPSATCSVRVDYTSAYSPEDNAFLSETIIKAHRFAVESRGLVADESSAMSDRALCDNLKCKTEDTVLEPD